MKIVTLIIGLLAVLTYPGLALTTELVTVDTPRGKSQPFLFALRDNPRAGVILFVGGDGVLGISDSREITMMENNFLARTFEDFLNKDFMVALVDVTVGMKKFSTKFRTFRFG